MSNDTARKSQAPRNRWWLAERWRRQPARRPSSHLVLLTSLNRHVLLADVLDDPRVAMLASEDTCWTFAKQQHEAARPSRWQRRERQSWVSQRKVLEAKRQRLAELAAETRSWPADKNS